MNIEFELRKQYHVHKCNEMQHDTTAKSLKNAHTIDFNGVFFRVCMWKSLFVIFY